MASAGGTYYYDELVREDASGAIGTMAQVLENDSLVLYKEQCTQMIRDFKHVRVVLGKRKEIRSNSSSSLILKELYRQTFAAKAVLESCCCCTKVKKDNRTAVYSWLQVALTQNDEAVFKVIWDDLKWCVGLVQIVTTGLDDVKRNELIEADKKDLKQKLEEFVAQGALEGIVQEEDRAQSIELAKFLLARLNNDGNHVFFATDCDSDNVWSQRQSLNDLGHTMTSSVTAIDWFGVKLARKTFRNQLPNGDYLVERQIMAPLNHPNVVRFISCDQKRAPAILMEYVEGNLLEYLTQRANEYAAQPSGWVGTVLSSSAGSIILEVVDMMYQIALAMEYLHGQGVAHCDIKPSNVLLNPYRVPGFEAYVQLKLADFGVSKSGLTDDYLRDSSKESRGTTIYRAPELRGKARNVDFKKADLFSYALTCWHILYGEEPFANMKTGTLHEELLRGTRPDIDPEVPTPLRDLIQRCWSTSPQERPTFSEVCLDLRRFKEERLLGFISPTLLISVPENKTKRRWEVLQSSFKAVKNLMRFLSNSEQVEDSTGGRTSRFGAFGCFSRLEPRNAYPVYRGPD